MRKITLSPNHCTYIIVSGATTDELEKNINEIIEQGWNADNLVKGGWEFIGGVSSDGKNFFQAMRHCPAATESKNQSESTYEITE